MFKHSMTAVATVLVIAGIAPAQSTTRVSVDSGGTQGDGACDIRPVISADGRFAAWSGVASNHVPGDTNAGGDVFVRDLLTGVTERASVPTGGSQAQGHSTAPSISANGRYVAFESSATNLVGPDNNQRDDVFVRDRWTGVTERVSSAPGGAESTGTNRAASISADGSRVAFMSLSENLVPGDTNGTWDIFVHDRASGLTVRASVGVNGAQGDGGSQHPSISANGRFVAFVSSATNLVTGDTNGKTDVFVRDLTGLTTARVHVDSNGIQGDQNADGIAAPAVSADGRYVAFGSQATNLVFGDTNGRYDVFVHDRATVATSRVSSDITGQPAEHHSRECRISQDGRYVAFVSWAADLVTGDTNGLEDIFLRDRLLGTTERVNLSDSGVEANDAGYGLSLSGDGRRVLFHSRASTLVGGDTNGAADIFLRDREPAPTVSVVCAGDGSGAACPCGNWSPAGSGAGCSNSLGQSGRLRSVGMPRVSADSFVLIGDGMPNSSALYFQGTTQRNGGLGSPFGDGLRCAAGAVIRLGTATNVDGASQFPAAGDPPVSVRGGLPPGGGTRTYQVWYRNAAAFCTVSTFNLTNGLSTVWVP